MATFEAKVYKLAIEPHNNADTLELAVVGDYRSIVRKGQFKTGDLGVYIPEAALVPENVLFQLGLIGKLAGPQKNRVKAMKLRGIVSQGLVLQCLPDVGERTSHYVMYTDPETGVEEFRTVQEGDDVTEFLRITKWEPPIPVHMAGEVANAFGYTVNYDIENIKKYPDVLVDDEEVVMTEKLHGTWTCLGYNPAYGDIVTSKGMSGQGLVFKFNEANANNLYIRSLKSTEQMIDIGADEDTGETLYDVQNVIVRAYQFFSGMSSFYILGETFGKGVQDLAYGTTEPQFRVFDCYVGEPGKGRYMGYDDLVNFCKAVDVEMVPLVYRGPYSKAKLLEVTNGKETFSGKAMNIREGVVVKPVQERYHPEIRRVQLKSVSDAYLLRGGDVTELT
jgi:RNA ligase (TIGR02306 family)